MFIVDKDGWISDSRITKEHRVAIEHSPIALINAVVLHRTDSLSATSVLNAWKTQKEGAHFLVSESGKIFQTASLKKQCWHVGKIYSKCETVSSCSDEDSKAMEAILHRKDINWGKKFGLITQRTKERLSTSISA